MVWIFENLAPALRRRARERRIARIEETVDVDRARQDEREAERERNDDRVRRDRRCQLRRTAGDPADDDADEREERDRAGTRSIAPGSSRKDREVRQSV